MLHKNRGVVCKTVPSCAHRRWRQLMALRFTAGVLLLFVVWLNLQSAHAGDASGRLPALARLPQKLGGEAAINVLGARLPAVALAHKLQAGQLRVLLRRERDLWADTDGRLGYSCGGLVVPRGTMAAPQPASDGPALAAVPINNPPIYHSKPGAPNVIYLDFSGGVCGAGYNGAVWGGLHIMSFLTKWAASLHKCIPFSERDVNSPQG